MTEKNTAKKTIPTILLFIAALSLAALVLSVYQSPTMAFLLEEFRIC